MLTGAAGDIMAQYSAVPEGDMFRTDARRYGHLEFFGFFASAVGHWNFTQELAPFTNMTFIQTGSAADEPGAIDAMVERLRQAQDAGVRAVLSIGPFLFLNLRGDLRPDEDIENFLVELRARLEFEGLLDTVLMIYPKDEPFREFVHYRDPSYWDQYVTGEVYEDIHEILVHANSLIKLVFPETPIGVILSGYNLHHRFFSIPENYDWVGFDCYQELFRSCDDRSFVQHYRRLLDFMQPHQRLMAVPEAWVNNEDVNRAGWPDILLSRFRHHYEIALNEPRFIAMMPFIWSFDAKGEVPGLGLNRFAELFDDGVENRGTLFVDFVKRIGRQIKAGAPEFPNMAWDETEASASRPASNVRGEIMSITPRGLVSAWAFEDALPHKNLRVRLLLRTAAGDLLFKTSLERTYVHDESLLQGDRIGRSFVGLHGYRYQLPRDVLARHGGQTLNLELVCFADGPDNEIGYSASLSFTAEYALSMPVLEGRTGQASPVASGSASRLLSLQ